MKYFVWLASLGVAVDKCHRLLAHFGSCRAIWQSQGADFPQDCGLTREDVRRLSSKSMGQADEILGACRQKGVALMTCDHADYPQNLRNIYDPPLVLYISGKLPDFNTLPAVTVVGQRKATPAGLLAAERLGHQLSTLGLVVVSGMAEGIDAAAHKGALRGNTPTVAVLGTAIDRPYPTFNIPLYRSILGSGAVVSEYPPGWMTDKSSFPRRNRIMSGLSMGTVVVEAQKRSGSLITAELAADQGRMVYAMPGAVDAHTSDGTNELIKDGAKLITGAYDIITDYAAIYGLDLHAARTAPEPERPRSIRAAFDKKIPLPATGDPVLDAIQGRTHIDQIAAACGLSQAQVLSRLTILELEGSVQQLPNQYFERIVASV